MMLKVVARLTDSSGNPLQGKTIYFYVSGNGNGGVGRFIYK